MKEEMLFEIMGNIDERYIHEAHKKDNKNSVRQILVFAACFSIIIGTAFFVGLHVKRNNFSSVSAAEIGKEEMPLEATMPSFIYYDSDKVIMYDYIGIWVYNLKKEQLVGFCDFRPIEMTQIQGYPCVFVEASSDGKYVRFYKSDDSIKYLYNVEDDSYEEVETYNDKLEWTVNLRNVTEKHSLSEYSETYEVAKNEYVTYVLDFNSDSNEPVKYKDLVIIIEKDGIKTEYKPFENNG